MRALWAAALAAACHSAKPVPPPAPAAVAAAAAPPDAGPACVELADLDRGIALCEEAALHSIDPAAALLSAARMHRQRMDERPDEAQACAADAHRSWSAHAASAQEVARPDAEALYLEAVCSAAWARMQGFTPLIERRGDLTAALSRVAQLAPDLDGSGPDRELGALLAALPAYAGGDLVEARRHLETAVARAPKDVRNRLVLARAVAVKAQDRALFEEQLKAAGDSPEAAALLQREDDLFGH